MGVKSFFDGTEYPCRIGRVDKELSKMGYFKAQARTTYELIYKLSGSSWQVFSDRTLRLAPDKLYIIPACCKYNEVQVDVPGEVIIVWFTLYDCPHEAEFVPEVLQLAPGNSVKALFEKLLSVWQHREADRLFEAQAIFQSILAAIARERNRAYRSSNAYQHIRPALEFLEQSYSNPDITISTLAALCGISDEYLRRLFRTCTGSPPMEYLRSLRLRQAKELLYAGNMGVAEAAMACGFTDPRYFTRVFVREYGILPSHVGHGTVG